MRKQADRGQIKVEEQKKGDRVMLSIKNLIFKEKLVQKLTKQYIRPYVIEEVVLKNTVELKLPASMKIYLVVKISKVVRDRKLVKKQKVEEPKLVE